jgi:hypothetical protein
MTHEQYNQLLLGASKSTRNLNLPADGAGEDAKLERHPVNATLGKVQVQERTSARFLVRLTSTRKRLIDEDNLCEKYHVDLCRYAGVLPDDDPSQTRIEVRQVKAEKGQDETVEIEVFAMETNQPIPRPSPNPSVDGSRESAGGRDTNEVVEL